MANVTWTLGNPNRTSSTWNRSPSATPWSGLPGDEPLYPGQVAADADLVTLNTGNGSNYTVTVNVSADIAGLTLSGNVTPPRTTTLVMTAGNTLTVSGNIALDPNSKIDGSGTIAVGGVIGNFGTIVPGTGGGGSLDLTGGGSIASGVLLRMDTIGTNLLQLDLAGGVNSAAPISLTSANQTLEISKGNVTINGGAQSLSGGAHIVMAGGTLTAGSGVTFNTATLGGSGTVAANLTRTGGTDTITASDGTLDLTGTFGAGLVAAIDSTKVSDLKFDNTATSSTAITISNANQTLEIGPSGALTIGAAESITNGTIKLDGGSLTDTLGLTIGAGASLTGSGTVTTGTTPTTDFDGPGAVTATGGVLDFTQATNSASATAYDVAAVAGSVLQFDGAVGTASNHPTVTFDSVATGGLGTLSLTDATNNDFHGTVNNFVIHDQIQVLNADHVTLTGGGSTLNVFNAADTQIETIALGQSHTGFTFSVDTATDTITTDMPCYVAGTRILTATGERMVESLLQGDIALTLANGELAAQPVTWLGRRRIDLTAHPHPETVAPIRIRRGTFADNMPHTDLLVSPDHAIFVDSKLICARQLINGTTIYQEKGWTSVEYFHVELDSHAILLAEGLPAESYLNTGNHGFFANSGEPLVLHPDLTDETDYPTREAGSCAPFVWDEASVHPVWQRLSERAAALGQPVRPAATTNDPALHLVAAGRRIKPIYADAGLFIFPLPRNAGAVRLVSRASAPTDARPWLDDRRRLGVRLARIVLRDATEVREIPVDHPDLKQGWWAVERDGTAMGRWTDGDAVLPLPAMHGVTMLEIHLRGTLDYVVSEEDRQAA
jgi:Hint domain